MNILLVNPPHPSIGSRIPVEHLPPLGLLAIGGPLLDAGHRVGLLDAEFGPMPVSAIASEARRRGPDIVMIGHSGSTSGHPSAMDVACAIRAALPRVWIVYGGVFPTFHWREILIAEPQVDVIVRGEGEETVVRLVRALETGGSLDDVPGVAFRPTMRHGISLSRARHAFHEPLSRLRHPLPVADDGERAGGEGARPRLDSCSLDDRIDVGSHRPACRNPALRLPFRSPVAAPNHAQGRVPIPSSPEPMPLGLPKATTPAPVIQDLDAHRIGWELIDHRRYSYWGNRRAVVVQFSRGCSHRCNYCGQRPFWRQWRHRDPVKFARELARLYREHGVEVINFADENPTASRPVWQTFLEAIIAEKVALILVGSTRADDIVRDADILHLYKKAGVARFLLGLESVDEDTLRSLRKDSRKETDREAIRLLRQHGILAMVAYVTGFKEETDRDYWRAVRQIVSYDPDQIQILYATPHRWTPYARASGERRVIQTDLSRWDYKHQVLANRNLPPWRTLLWVKAIEAVVQLRPRSLWRYLAHPDLGLRQAMRWYYRIGRQVWPYEIWHFLVRDRRTKSGPTLARFLNGERQQAARRMLSPCGPTETTESGPPFHEPPLGSSAAAGRGGFANSRIEKGSRLRRSGTDPSDEGEWGESWFRGSMREQFRRILSPALNSIRWLRGGNRAA